MIGAALLLGGYVLLLFGLLAWMVRLAFTGRDPWSGRGR